MPFSAQWLSLREPADQRARDKSLLAKAAALVGNAPIVMDLGSGTGSSYRAMHEHLPQGTRWHLVDNDAELLSIAKAQIGALATAHQVDLADLDALPNLKPDLIVGSALLDLVSSSWLEKLIAKFQTPFYFALSYDGNMSFSPQIELDQSITHSFNQHQRTDKGFGIALGPDAARSAIEIFSEAGYQVFYRQSNWEIGPEETGLAKELIGGIAQAAAEVGNSQAGLWEHQRVLDLKRSYCTIGHIDFLAIPPKG